MSLVLADYAEKLQKTSKSRDPKSRKSHSKKDAPAVLKISRHQQKRAFSTQSGVNRKSDFEARQVAFDPQETSASIWRKWVSPIGRCFEPIEYRLVSGGQA
jgi:hypothetical protein